MTYEHTLAVHPIIGSLHGTEDQPRLAFASVNLLTCSDVVLTTVMNLWATGLVEEPGERWAPIPCSRPRGGTQRGYQMLTFEMRRYLSKFWVLVDNPNQDLLCIYVPRASPRVRLCAGGE